MLRLSITAGDFVCTKKIAHEREVLAALERFTMRNFLSVGLSGEPCLPLTYKKNR